MVAQKVACVPQIASEPQVLRPRRSHGVRRLGVVRAADGLPGPGSGGACVEASP